MGRGSKTQQQVGENLKKITWREKSWMLQHVAAVRRPTTNFLFMLFKKSDVVELKLTIRDISAI